MLMVDATLQKLLSRLPVTVFGLLGAWGEKSFHTV
jgi:hypothetical protein